ncbi:SPW repeat protein [Solimicrobium silvestre]|uniref:SPW repeat n=1 Tax=Solimicrobium silvestre TaxID=2099400 RepID=A0A2S9GYX9_9BURK|nr:SPW repeat protein [Solimicrobium silvestre]PRC92944.1 SPW repeat [Solimicrobium silvestre]
MSLRWQDWVSALLGCWLLVSPWEMGYLLNLDAKGNACGVGAALIIFNLISACRKVDDGQEIVNIVLGIWLILSPYALSFSTEKNLTLNVIAVGSAVIILAAWQMFDAIRMFKSNKLD